MFDLPQFASITPEWYARLQYHDELDSTNDEARRLAEDGAEHGTVVLADFQQAGRGRRGSSWVSGSGEGLLFSIILRPEFAISQWSRLALAAGLGIATALNSNWDVHAQVKWPNDIYLANKKCAGILIEAHEGCVIVGVGLNVIASPDAGGADMSSIALGDVVGIELSREQVLAAVLDHIWHEVNTCDSDFDNQIARLRELCFLTGKAVTFNVADKTHQGVVRGIGNDGALMVESSGVVEPFLQAAEIRVI